MFHLVKKVLNFVKKKFYVPRPPSSTLWWVYFERLRQQVHISDKPNQNKIFQSNSTFEKKGWKIRPNVAKYVLGLI